MRIIVCVKQVPDTTVPLQIDTKTNSFKEEGVIYVLNPQDKCALEEAIRIKERVGGEVTAITLGPPRSKKALRSCLAMGADKAIHIYDNSFELDAYATSVVLAKAISTLPYDLILCGKQAIDDNAGLVGPGIAETLGLPGVFGVTRIELSPDTQTMVVHRKIERGDREVVECPIPAVLTMESGINEPRYPSLPDHMAALKAQIPTLDHASLNIHPGTLTRMMQVVGVSSPRPRPKKLFVPDSTLPPAERMKLMLSGGVAEKKSELLTGPPSQVASKIIQYLIREKILSI